MSESQVMDELQTGTFLTGPSPRKWPDTIRLVSWNINRGLQLNGIIEFLATSSADLILLQETDVHARRTHHRDIPREIAQALRMNYIFGREFEELSQGSRTRPAYHGQTTLSRLPLSHARILKFRRQSAFWRPRWFIPPLESFQRRLGARMALISDITIQGRTLVVYNAHLESRGNDDLRSNQLIELLSQARNTSPGTQAVFAGDFNFDLSHEPAARLLAGMQLDHPFARLGGRRTVLNCRRARCGAIDWILTMGTVSASNPQVHDSIGASDHYPLSVQIHL
jgi:endonuclease/exonuclease/phosphatase family metal-dependent hydrolase